MWEISSRKIPAVHGLLVPAPAGSLAQVFDDLKGPIDYKLPFTIELSISDAEKVAKWLFPEGLRTW
jgi:hypothetical protein